MKLKSLSEQTIVITGASSGIGRATARMAAGRGARVVAAARSGAALTSLVDEITRDGGSAISVVADVGDPRAVERIAAAAEERYGGFDTWVNNAGVAIYGRILETPEQEARRLFETNFWGTVHGSRVAARHLAQRGGAILNVGSTESDRALPLMGFYAASKHAIKAFTDALRMEIEEAGAPISVTLIKPGSIDTPLPRHARVHIGTEPQVPPPVYAPSVAAEAILHCAEYSVRDLFVGAGGKAIAAAGTYAPRLTDRLMESTMFDLQKTGRPMSARASALFHPTNDPRERGDYPGHVAKSSLYTTMSLHPVMTGAVALGVGLALMNFARSSGPARAARDS